MTTTTIPAARITAAAARLNVDLATAAEIAGRNVAACEAVAAHLDAIVTYAPVGSCCKPRPTGDEVTFACAHLRRLWAARTYVELARVGAPVTGAFGCNCSGTGKFYSGGAVVNGQYTGTVGVCFRCGGKGWQNEADRKRNDYYDNHVRRIPGF